MTTVMSISSANVLIVDGKEIKTDDNCFLAQEQREVCWRHKEMNLRNEGKDIHGL